jgi:uroporphyrinogen decarboxylase
MKRSVEALHRRGLAAKGELSQTIFETAWSVRGLEQTLLDMVDRPDMVEALCDRMTAIRVVQARQMAAAGVDILRLGDDVSGQIGMLMSPSSWRRWLKPRLAQVIAAAKEVKPDIHIGYHSDGDCRAVIAELAEIGVDALNPIQPECMDPVAIKKQFGDKLTLWGTIGTQTTMAFASPSEVRSLVKERVATVGEGGGLILAPTHILEPEVPWANIVAFFDAIEEFGQRAAG